jgi:Domain of unknown function (DUF4388)
MTTINFFLVSLENQFFPINLIEKSPLYKQIPSMNFSNGEELYVDLLHPACTEIGELKEWNDRIGPVILVTRMPLTGASSGSLKKDNFEIIHIDDVVKRIKNRREISETSQDDLLCRTIPFKGTMDGAIWGEILSSIYSGELTGKLYVKGAKYKKVLSFYKGIPTEIRSNKGQELLGKMLVEEGVITSEQCDDSVKTMQGAKKQQGQALIEMELLDDETLEEALDRQWAVKLIDLFEWTEGDYNFKEQSIEKPKRDLPFPVWEVIYNGLIFISKGLISASLQRVNSQYLIPNPISKLRYQPIPLSFDFTPFTKIDGKITIEEFLNNSDYEIKKVLVALLLSDNIILSVNPLPVPFPFGGIPISEDYGNGAADKIDFFEKEYSGSPMETGVRENWLRKLHGDRFIQESEELVEKANQYFTQLIEKRIYPKISIRGLSNFHLGWKNENE